MRIIKRHRTKQGLVGLLLAALVGGALIAGSGPQADAATIGDTLQNGTTTVPKDSSGNPWNTYLIPGLNRVRSSSEGSFVQWGYAGWPGYNASQSMPLADELSTNPVKGTNQVALDNNWLFPTKGTEITRDWSYPNAPNANQTGSPVSVTFKNQGSNKHGTPYFSLNYVDKNDLIDFSSQQNALNFMAGTTQPNFNTQNVKSKMTYNPTTQKFSLANNQSMDNGYLQATGNVPLQAAVAKSNSTTDATMAGDWAVMVRVQVADGIDAKALASSIDWDKSYYYLTVDSATLNIGVSITEPNINFPLQFDHHVYLDPNDSHSFFLKVKGIPFNFTKSYNSSGKVTGQMYLQKGQSDYADYLNNRRIANSTSAYTLDKVDNGQQSTNLDNSALTTGSGAGIQPNFPINTGDKDGWFGAKATIWDPFGGLAREHGLTIFSSASPVFDTGDIGRMISLINGSDPSSSRPMATTILSAITSAVVKSLAGYFVDNAFSGGAHINFSFDMSKYDAGTTKDQQALTRGRLFAAPKADGTFNSATGQGTSDAIKITMFDSSELVDPYSVTKGLAREDGNSSYTTLQKQLVAGTTPADYSVINATSDAQLDTMGTRYPTYTNFSSWTGAIVPYDREHWTDDSQNPVNTSFTDTLHSQGKFGTDLKSQTSTPDPANDGVLVNDGSPFNIDQAAKFTSEYIDKYKPTFDSKDTTKLTTAGVIKPQRYANVYSLYNYDSQGVGTLPADGEPVPVYTTTGTGGNNLSVKAGKALMTSPPMATNVAQGATQLTASLDNGKWHYTGTMDSGGTTLQLADATIGLSQPLNPQLTLNGQSPYLVDDTALKGSGVTRQLGTWRDPLAITASDSLTASLSTQEPASGGTSGITQQQDANWTSITDVDTRAHAMSFNIANGNAFANPDDASRVTHPNGKLNAQFAYQMPTKDSPQSRVYYGEIQLQRTKTVPLATGYVLDPTADYNKAKANYYIFRNQDAPDVSWYTVKKYFDTTNQPTTHYVTADDKSNQNAIPVKSEVTQTDQGKQNKNQDLDIWIPKVTGTSLQNANTTPITVTDNTGGSGTTIASANIKDISAQQPSWVSAGYYTHSIHFPEVPTKFTYAYNYVISSGGVDASEYKVPLYDVIRNSTQMLGLSNAIYFDTMHAVNLLHAPSFDFGKNNVPTAAANYKLTDDSKANAYFEAQENDGDNKHNTYTWLLSATMTPFKSSMTDTGYSDFNILLGNPYRDAAGTEKDDNASHQPNPAGLISDGYSSPELYYVNPMDEPDTPSYDANSIKRYYPNASLTVPAETITPGKYQSTITYTVSDNGSI